ncbi:MAG: mechanosensitive ion channel [Bacteroidetes bacterium]|nr:MAG: mechanosensitive ion channel [Bacteroidota bacterium]
MEIHYIQLIETAVLVVLYVLIRSASGSIIDRTLNERFIQESRGAAIKRVLNITLLIITFVFISLIWGVKQNDLAVFIGSILTVVGVAFFAQWSILSNITSSIILFFNHPIKVNDEIVILEAKEYTIEGKVLHIGLFFITLQTHDGEEITLPNNLFISKSIKKKNGHVL